MITILPKAGIGNKTVVVSATPNVTNADIIETHTVVNDNITKTLTVVQYYTQYFELSGDTIPATGGSVELTLKSHDETLVLMIPSWAEVKADGEYIGIGEIIPSGDTVITIDVGNNTGESRTSSFVLEYQYANTVARLRQDIKQLGGFEAYADFVRPITILNWDATTIPVKISANTDYEVVSNQQVFTGTTGVTDFVFETSPNYSDNIKTILIATRKDGHLLSTLRIEQQPYSDN